MKIIRNGPQRYPFAVIKGTHARDILSLFIITVEDYLKARHFVKRRD